MGPRKYVSLVTYKMCIFIISALENSYASKETRDILERISRKFPSSGLKFIFRMNSTHSKAYLLRKVARLCNTLEGLYVINYSGNTPIDDVIKNVIHNCRSLRDLSLEGCYELTDDGLMHIAQKCKQIKYLNLTWCYELSSKGINNLLKSCTELEELELEQCDFKEDGTYSNYTLELDNILTNLNVFLPNIIVLNLGYCNGISDKAIFAISQNCKFLSKFNLRGCDRITDKGIDTLVENCKALCYLDLSWCDLITDTSLVSISVSPNCKNLDGLNLDRCCKITDAGICVLSKGCENLTYLNVSWCTKISTRGISFVVQNCKKLRSLYLIQCFLIRKSVIESIAKECEIYF